MSLYLSLVKSFHVYIVLVWGSHRWKQWVDISVSWEFDSIDSMLMATQGLPVAFCLALPELWSSWSVMHYCAIFRPLFQNCQEWHDKWLQMTSNDKVWYGKAVGKVAAHVPEDLRCILTSVWWTWSESLRKEHLASPSGVNPNNIDTRNQSVGTSPKSPALSGHFKALEAFKSHSYKQQSKYKHMGRCALNAHKIETTNAWHVQSQTNAKRCQMWRTQSFLRLKKPPLRWTFESNDFQNLLNEFRSAVRSSFRCSFCSIHQASLLQ